MLRMHDAANPLASIPPLVVDLAVAAAVTWVGLATSLASSSSHGIPGSHEGRHFDVLAITLTVAVGLALIPRRRFSLSVMAICAALVAVFEARGYRLGLNQAGLLVALFTVTSQRRRLWTPPAVAIAYTELLYDHFHAWSGSRAWIYLGTGAWVAAVTIVGDGARRLMESRALLKAYKEQEQRKHRDREQRAVLLERIRIARELHDVTAHHLSVIAVQAGVARFVLDKEPETADQALRAISEVGSEGLAELRRLISLLRPDDDEGARAQTSDPPAPGVAQLPVLIERVGLSGTPSRYTVAGHQRPLPAGIELCVYRVVQESLTNVLKHAPGSSVEVRLEYEPDRVRVTIADTGPHRAALHRIRIPAAAITQAARHSGSGVGLTGMRERAALYGGELSAGRKPDGGFEVALTLPVDAVDVDEGEVAGAVAGVTGR
jgi:signal transduction histidine kinase